MSDPDLPPCQLECESKEWACCTTEPHDSFSCIRLPDHPMPHVACGMKIHAMHVRSDPEGA